MHDDVEQQGHPANIQIFVTYQPDREGRVVQLTSSPTQHTIEILAELYRTGDRTMVQLFSRPDGTAWTYPLAELLTAIEAAVTAVEATVTYSVLLRPGQENQTSIDGLDIDALDGWLRAHGEVGDVFEYSWNMPGDGHSATGHGVVDVHGEAAYRLRP